MESRTQGSRPRTQKKSEAKDSLSEDRHSRGQGQECSRPRPRTQAQVLSKKKKKKKKKKKVFIKIFQAISTKKRFPKKFSSASQNFNLRPQGQGLDLRGQGLQNVSSRTPPLLTLTLTKRKTVKFSNFIFWAHFLQVFRLVSISTKCPAQRTCMERQESRSKAGAPGVQVRNWSASLP